MRTLNLAPFLHSAIGFDNMFDLGGLGDVPSAKNNGRTLALASKAQSFPPYNIEKLDEDAYVITMALAGFSEEDLNITIEGDTLTIEGNAGEQDDVEERNYLHKGIAKRAFERQFQLAENIKVTDAEFTNGLLNVALKREVPEHKKPRKVEISKGNSKKLPFKAA